MVLSKIVGRNIKHIRETKGIKQVNLALALKLSPQTLSYMENGKSEIALNKLEQIAKVLEVSVLDLFSGSNFEDPMAERKKVLEDAAIGLVNMYNDILLERNKEGLLFQQMNKLIQAQEQIIDLLKELLDIKMNTGNDKI